MKLKILLPIAVLIIVAIFFRFYNLDSVPPGLYPDEAMNGNNALEAISTAPPADGYKVFYPENNGREGLFINIQAFFLKIFGVREPWVLRSVSAIFGVLTVLGIYFLVLEVLRNGTRDTVYRAYRQAGEIRYTTIAFLSSFFVAISFWHINFSRIGFRAIMAPMFLTWALYFLIKSLNQARNNLQLTTYNLQPESRKSLVVSWILIILSGLLYGLGMHSYIAYRGTPLLIIFIYLFYWWINKTEINFKKIFASFLVFVVFALIAFAPLGTYFVQNPQDFMGRTGQLSIFASQTPLKDLGTNVLKTLAMFNIRGDGNWRHNYSGSPELFWLVGIFFILGTISGLISLFKKSSSENQNTVYPAYRQAGGTRYTKFLFVVCLAWIAVAFLPVVISNEGIPHALRSILMIPPVYILAGMGGAYLVEFLLKKINKRIVFVFGSFILLAMIAQSFVSYFVLWANNPNTASAFSQKYTDLGREINIISDSIKKYVVVNAGGVDVRGVPMPAQTVMFLTDTFTPEKQKGKNIFYVLPKEINQIPQNAYTVNLK